jgi:hypothetical protein
MYYYPLKIWIVVHRLSKSCAGSNTTLKASGDCLAGMGIARLGVVAASEIKIKVKYTRLDNLF